MRLHYIANARMPSEKAHAIQIAKMCEALIEEGVEVTLIVPCRGAPKQTIREFYGLRRDIPLTRLPALDLHHRGRIGYALGTASFMISYALYVLARVKKGDAAYTVDLDHAAYGMLPFLGVPYFSEMHGGKPNTFIHRALFKKAAGIIATNEITREQLMREFSLPEEKVIVEPNGVDFSKFIPTEKEAARLKLGLGSGMKLALYVGRFFDWKGLAILAEAADLLAGEVTIGLVGGEAEEFKKVAGVGPGPLVFYGSQPYTQMPLWESAADALLVLGTRRDEQSWRYTSPMKVFEYMAMKRPIVASKTPALENILTEGECFFYAPDNAQSLADAVRAAMRGAGEKPALAYEKARRYSWDMRAKRVLEFVAKNIK